MPAYYFAALQDYSLHATICRPDSSEADLHATICRPYSSEADLHATIFRPDFFAQWYCEVDNGPDLKKKLLHFHRFKKIERIINDAFVLLTNRSV